MSKFPLHKNKMRFFLNTFYIWVKAMYYLFLIINVPAPVSKLPTCALAKRYYLCLGSTRKTRLNNSFFYSSADPFYLGKEVMLNFYTGMPVSKNKPWKPQLGTGCSRKLFDFLILPIVLNFFVRRRLFFEA